MTKRASRAVFKAEKDEPYGLVRKEDPLSLQSGEEMPVHSYRMGSR